MSACPDANMVKIRRLLRKYKGDTDKVIDALYEEAAKEVENEAKSQPDQQEQEEQEEQKEKNEDSPKEQSAKKPKRISAREKKRLDKMRRKENQRAKRQGGAVQPDIGDDTQQITNSMKEMYV